MPSLRHVPRWARAVAAVVVAGLVALPLGGWDTVERGSGAIERLEPGQRHDADQFATSVTRAEVLPVRPGSPLDPEPGIAYLAVYGQVENRTEATQVARTDLVSVEVGGRTLEDADSLVLVADGSSAPELQPGLPVDLAFVWEIEEGSVTTGDPVEVSVVDRTAIESFVSSGTIWIDPRVGAVVDLAVS